MAASSREAAGWKTRPPLSPAIEWRKERARSASAVFGLCAPGKATG